MVTRKYSYVNRRKSRRSSRRKSRRNSRRKSRSIRRQKCPKPCWPGYKRVKGKGCGKGSCKKK